jgi:hypothetical protein
MSHAELVDAMVKMVVEKAEKGESVQLPKHTTSMLSKFISSATLFLRSTLKTFKLIDDNEEDSANGHLSISQLQKKAEEQQAKTFRLTFVLASVFFLVRLWYGGHLSAMMDLLQRGDIGFGAHEEERERQLPSYFDEEEF